MANIEMSTLTIGETTYEVVDETAREQIKEADNKIPTKTSQLTNDSGYLKSFTETDPTVPAWAKAASKPSYTKSEVGLGNVDNVKQYSASNPPPYPVTSVNGKTGAVTVDVPTALSQLTADSTHRVVTDAEKSAWNAKSNFSGSYNDLTNKPTIPTVPTKVSAFTNDANYVTEAGLATKGYAKNTDIEQYETLTLGVHTDGKIYLFKNSRPVGVGVEMGASGDVVGYIDENNNIVLSGALADGTYNVKYEMEDGTFVEIGDMTLGEVEMIIPCEYIQNSTVDELAVAGYVDIGYVNTEQTGIKVTFELPSTPTASSVGYFGNTDICCGGTGGTSDMRAYLGGVKSYQLVASQVANTEYIVGVNYLNDGKASINGTQKNWNSGTKTFQKKESITIGKQNGNANYSKGSYIKIKDVYVTEGTAVLKHLVPAYRNTDDVCGLYDVDTGDFFAGTGNFTHGNAV